MPGVIRKPRFKASPAFSFPDLEAQASAILRRANTEAQQIISDARRRAGKEREAVHAQARAQGFEQGRREGQEQASRQAAAAALQEARQELQRLLGALGAGLAEYERRKHDLLAAAESELIRLALAIARRVCKRAAARDPEVAAANMQALLQLVQHEHDLIVRVSPAELERLKELADGFVRTAGESRHVRIEADAALQRGDCVLVTRTGTVDAALDVQLDRIAEALLNAEPDETRGRADGG
ncbi:MAG: hypothetical protein HRF50_08500 [Phycisphaerae bacterium]|jgi:flagellar assembly protein FliH